MPLILGRLTMHNCTPLLHEIVGRIQSWRAKHLSFASTLQGPVNFFDSRYLGRCFLKFGNFFSLAWWLYPANIDLISYVLFSFMCLKLDTMNSLKHSICKQKVHKTTHGFIARTSNYHHTITQAWRQFPKKI